MKNGIISIMNKYAKILKQTPIFLSLLAALIFVIPANFTLADPAYNQVAQATSDEKSRLQQQLQEIQNEIAQYEQQLTQVQSQKNTLANKLKQLSAQKSKVQLQIQETSLNLKNIDQQMDETQQLIADDTEHINNLREKIANLLPAIYDKDQQSAVEMLLAQDGLIGFYQELDSYEEINNNLNELLGQLDAESKQLKAEEDQLANQQEQQQGFLQIQSIQNQQLASNISEQNQVLTETKGQEAAYQATLSDKKAQAAKIQSRIYELFGTTPGTSQVTFGQAVAIAQSVSAATGVRAAFLLSILTQESNLGKNVGTCNRAGDPPSKSYKVVMHPTRDIPPFLKITDSLGLNPDTTPISCPMFRSGKQIGWGGAMGPAQFIPSTWMGYAPKVAAITGKPANPWDINDAFLAAAIKLKADGAGSVSGEWSAAMRYFSGGTNPAFRFYGDSVAARANQYQADIDALNNQ